MTTGRLAHAAEAAVVALARTGDAAAFVELVSRREAGLRGMLARLSGDATLAEDLAQQAFVAAWKALPGLREPIEPSGENVVVTLAKMSRPFLSNGYTSRSHRNFLAAQEVGITTVVVTELGFPRILGVTEFDAVEVIDGIEHRRLDRGPGCDDKTMPVAQAIPVTRIPCARNRPRMEPRAAPSARRMPIARRCSVTA